MRRGRIAGVPGPALGLRVTRNAGGGSRGGGKRPWAGAA